MHWAWIFLMLAILAEVIGTTCMKLSEGLRHLLPSVLVFVFYALSLTAFTMAIKKIDVSVAYAIWAGLGVALVATVGVTYFNEPLTLQKIGWLTLIVIGVVGLQTQA